MSKIKGFYSAVDKAAEALTRNKGTGKEFITELSKVKGIKPTEMQTRKLERIIEMPKMTKEEFLNKLKELPPPQLRETHIGEPSQKEIRSLAEQLMHDDAVEEAGMNRYNRFEVEDDVDAIFEDKMYNEEQKYLDLAREQILDEGGGTKFFDYKTEGGENYREILMRLPSDAKKNQKRMFELEAKERRSSVGRDFGNISPEEVEELNQLRELAKNPKQDYQSKHWHEPNVLAHMRVQDRITPTYTKAQIEDIGRRMAESLGVDAKSLASGSPSVAVQRGVITPLEAAQFSHAKKFKNVDTTGATQKVLHVEEIQSDWHQEGRKKGYGSLSKEESDELQALLKKENDEDGLLAKDLNRARELEERAKNLVPDAPFKKNWHELAMKRLLNYAAENGYDKIAVTPGAEQAKRYDLSKHINDLQYDPQTKTLTAWDHSGNKVVDRMNTSEDQLADYIGKEGAQKLLAQNPQDTHVKQLFGADLQVGGEGMKGFYDQMIPSYLNEFGKKYNVQVSPFDIETEGERLVPQIHAPGIDYRPEPLKIPAETMQLHGFDITPQMREEINTQGLPMFAEGGVVKAAVGGEYNTDPDMQDGSNIIQGTVFKRGGRVHVSKNPDTMLLDLISRN